MNSFLYPHPLAPSQRAGENLCGATPLPCVGDTPTPPTGYQSPCKNLDGKGVENGSC